MKFLNSIRGMTARLLRFFFKFLKNNGALVALIILFIINALWQKGVFLDPQNLRNILSQNATTGIIAIGMTLVIIGGGIDLSVGSMMGLLGVLSLLGMNKATSDPTQTAIAVVVGLGAGAFLGAMNGIVITWGKIAPFVATLAGLAGFRSIALGLTNAGQTLANSKTLFPSLAQGGVPIPGAQLGNGSPLLLQWPTFIFFGIAAVGSWILNRSIYGRRLIAVGANETAAIYSGIKTNQIKVIAYTFLGLCTGVAAVCQTARLASVSSSSLGLYIELDAIAAVVIGGTSLNGGKGQVWSTVIGVLILGIVNNMLITANIDSNWQGCFKGVIILLAVLIQRGQKSTS